MDIVFGLFIIFPIGALIVGLLFIRMFMKLKQVLCAITGISWILYAVYEYLMYARILCSGECNIRVDLFLIYPALIVLSVSSLACYFYKKRKISSNSRP